MKLVYNWVENIQAAAYNGASTVDPYWSNETKIPC